MEQSILLYSCLFINIFFIFICQTGWSNLSNWKLKVLDEVSLLVLTGSRILLTVRFAFWETQELNIQNTIQKCNNLVSSLYKSFYLTLPPKCFTFQSLPVENMCKLLEYQSKLSIQRHVGKNLILKPPMSPKTIHFMDSHESTAKWNIRVFYALMNLCTHLEIGRVEEVAFIDWKFYASRKTGHNLSWKKTFCIRLVAFAQKLVVFGCVQSL